MSGSDRADEGQEAFRRHLLRDLSRRVHLHKDQPTPTGLDIGCRAGHTTELLARHGVAARGLDPVAENVQAARAAHPDLSFAAGDVLDLPFAPDAFDVAISFGLIQGEDDWWRVVAEAVRVVRPGGYVVVETARAYPWWEMLWRLAAGRAPRAPSWRTVWGEARRHLQRTALPIACGPRRFAPADLIACAEPLPVLQVIVHDPRRGWRGHETMWGVTLMKHEHVAQAAVPPLVVACAHCRQHGVRELRVGRE